MANVQIIDVTKLSTDKLMIDSEAFNQLSANYYWVSSNTSIIYATEGSVVDD